jgi:hypothetical protein
MSTVVWSEWQLGIWVDRCEDNTVIIGESKYVQYTTVLILFNWTFYFPEGFQHSWRLTWLGADPMEQSQSLLKGPEFTISTVLARADRAGQFFTIPTNFTPTKINTG